MNELILSLSLSSLVSVTAGLIGAFALLRRMTLAADPMSHIALPGIGLALLFQFNPVVGGGAALIIGALLIWFIEAKTQINVDAVIGVVFAAALAVGTIITPEEELVEALFGSLQEISSLEFWLAAVAGVVIISFLLIFRHRIAVTLISPELAKASGIKVNVLNLFYLLAFAVSIILGLRFIGALLMGSLIIIPAVAARNLTSGMGAFLGFSAIVAFLSNLGGTLTSVKFGWELGPSVIAIASLFFIITAIIKAFRD